MSTKIQEVISNVAITANNEKQYARLQQSIPRTQQTFLEKVTLDINGFTDEQDFHECDVQVVEKFFTDDSK